MTGERIGYVRVNTFDQNPERQLEAANDRISNATAALPIFQHPDNRAGSRGTGYPVSTRSAKPIC